MDKQYHVFLLYCLVNDCVFNKINMKTHIFMKNNVLVEIDYLVFFRIPLKPLQESFVRLNRRYHGPNTNCALKLPLTVYARNKNEFTSFSSMK